MVAKHWLQSKTLWFNAISIGVLVAQYALNRHIVDADTAGLVIAAATIGLRAITTQPLTTESK